LPAVLFAAMGLNGCGNGVRGYAYGYPPPAYWSDFAESDDYGGFGWDGFPAVASFHDHFHHFDHFRQFGFNHALHPGTGFRPGTFNRDFHNDGSFQHSGSFHH
jgi:hypothetical protein